MGELRITFSEDTVTVTNGAGESETGPSRPRLESPQLDAALADAGAIRRSGLVDSIAPSHEVGSRLFESVFGGRAGRLYRREARSGDPLCVRIVRDPSERALP